MKLPSRFRASQASHGCILQASFLVFNCHKNNYKKRFKKMFLLFQ